MQIPDAGGRRAPNYFLTTFGRSSRNTACSCEVKTAPTLSQALHLINGETTSGKITEGGVVAKLLAASNDSAAAEELYLRCLCRAPTAAEAERVGAKLAGSADKKKALENLFWPCSTPMNSCSTTDCLRPLTPDF